MWADSNILIDWAGGPGDSKEDVEWLDGQLGRFFAENQPDHVTGIARNLAGLSVSSE